ncbi:MAG TPA: amidohydrolase family protein, partial [Dissulfurispiraceae bacterium]|nr:amidohydrolase family protein [Dissulfurispiraceae bacterium]
MLILFNNCSLLDTAGGVVLPERHVLIEDGIIREVSDSPLKASASAIAFDLAGKTLMPGLCDAHVHVTAVAPDFVRLERMAPSYIAISASKVLRGMIMRGFTTVRDAGGADWGLAEAVREGLCEGPRILFSGHALSQTGGHGDMRSGGEDRIYPFNPPLGTLGRICDGGTEGRRAARDELRKGAHQIKVMASGGVASPTDPVENTQFSLDEMQAIVEEAEAANTYVMAHAYNDRSIRRALECGVRSIEHGNLIEAGTLEMLREKKAFLV